MATMTGATFIEQDPSLRNIVDVQLMQYDLLSSLYNERVDEAMRTVTTEAVYDVAPAGNPS